jgi:predicted TIM-barrel fold metal-dependent hydrolase
MIATPEFMLAQMAWAGVDIAVLQNPWLYGQLNEFFSEAEKKYPHKFAGQVQVSEYEVDKPEEIERLRNGVRELGLTGGLYFSDRRAWDYGYRLHFDDKSFFPFWEEVQDLGILVSMDISPLLNPEHPEWTEIERYMAQSKRLENLANHFPEIPFVLVHGILLTVFGQGDQVVIPDEFWPIWQKPNIHMEILFPIQVSYPRPGATVWDYPYPQARPVIKELYERLGPEHLFWGSDMPNVERNCTYKQSLDYLVNYCDFIPANHMDLIIGDNAARLLRLET